MNHVKAEDPPRILMLVIYEPETTPRIKWITKLCAQIGRTDIIVFTTSTQKPLREYDGMTYIERVSYVYKLHIGVILIHNLLCNLLWKREVSNNGGPQDRLSVKTWSGMSKNSLKKTFSFFTNMIRNLLNAIRRQVNIVYHFFLANSILYLRAREVSVVPRFIICDDIYSLAAGLGIKKLFSCPLVYNLHDFSPEALTEAPIRGKKLIFFIEKRLIRHADVVIDVKSGEINYKTIFQEYFSSGGE